MSIAPVPAVTGAVPQTYTAPQSFGALQRQLHTLLPREQVLGDGQSTLEQMATPAEPPRLVRADVVEGGAMRARRVLGDPEVGFHAFLDGTQSSRVLAYADGIAIVHGTVAAVVRARRNRRMATWGRPLVMRRLYAPLARLAPEWHRALEALAIEVVDTSRPDRDQEEAAHPFALRDAAVHRVQSDRERAEQELAERWCGLEISPLFIDGGISGSERVAVSACTVGIVKSHRTLYAEDAALQTVLRLRRGERSSVIRITSPRRTTVASWYLRLRDTAGRDPMWGLVRVEIAYPGRIEEPRVGPRADQVSRWILAEAAPLALPDSRWDKMTYGVRDCEEFLRAIV
ncbi:MAG TPA: hypothetical protein VJU87_08200 [Gemmatimonadaceae bacterium]|nr:hypothetical protein [Gemmatimonadaceae bacterium]